MVEFLVVGAILLSSMFTNAENTELRQKNEDLRFENFKLQNHIPVEQKQLKIDVDKA